ncbi:MAG: hypothetical protein FWD31_12640 [Planctomycetaceae bacterium]|nr:hypothetical protein [Planctomycetaceae bacterium]
MSEKTTLGKHREIFRSIIPLLILAGGVIGATALVKLQKPPETKEDASDKRPLVALAEVASVLEGITLTADGVVVPYREIEIASEVAGRVVEKSDKIRAGSYVTQGTELLAINPLDYQLDVGRYQIELAQAEHSLIENQTENENAARLLELSRQELELQEKELKRIEELIKNRTVTESERDQTRRAVVMAETAVAQLENQISLINRRRANLELSRERTEIALERAKIDLERTKIKTPVEGMIVSAPVEKDSYISPGRVVVTLEDTSCVEVLCHLRATDLYWLWQQEPTADEPTNVYKIPQAPVTVIYRLGNQEYHWDGTLVRYDGSGLDPHTRMVPCRILVSDPKRIAKIADRSPGIVMTNGGVSTNRQEATRVEDSRLESRSGVPVLLRGMFVSVEINVHPKVPLLTIPDTALQPGNRVFVVEDGRLRITPVEVVRFENDAVTLRGDQNLAPGMKVIVSPLGYAENGMEVKSEE